MRLLWTFLLLTCFLFGLPAFGAGRDLTSIAYGPSPFGHFAPDVASNGAGFVTAWPMSLPGRSQIFASRADDAGHTLSPSAKWLADDLSAYSLQVVPFGTNYIVTWQSSSRYPAQRAIEITPSLDEVRSFTFPTSGRIAWNGREFAIARGTSLLLADRSGHTIGEVSLIDRAADVIAAGDDFIAVSSDDRVVLQRVSGDGVPVSRVVLEPPATTSNGLHPSGTSVASNGSELAVIWVMAMSGRSSYVLRSAIIGRDGVVQGMNSLSLEERVTKVSLVRQREQYRAVVVQTPLLGILSIFVTYTIDPHGGLAREERPAVPTDAFTSAVSSNGRILYAVEREDLTRDPDTTITTSSASRILGGPLGGEQSTRDVLSVIPRRQTNPRLVSLGVDFLGAWLDQVLYDDGVMVGSISREGVAGHETREIGVKNESLFHYDIAAGGTGYLLVWAQDSRLYARRFLPDGIAVDAEPIVIRAGAVSSFSEISAVWNDTQFFVAWAEAGAIFGAFLRPDGSVSSAQQLSSADTVSPLFVPANPHLAWNGREFLMVWDGFFYCISTCGPGPTPYRAVRISADGRPIDESSIVLSNSAGAQRVVSNGRDFLVTLDEWSGAIARLVRSDANGLAAGPAIRLGDYAAMTDVARLGDGFVAAVRYADRAMASWIGTVHISAGGEVASRMFVESGTGFIPDRPAIAINPMGDVLVVVSEVPAATGSQRLRSYRESEMRPFPDIPAPPLVTFATLGLNSIRVSWQPPPGMVNGYVIEVRRAGTNDFFTVALAPAEATSFLIGQYGIDTVRVRAWNVAGLSEPSNSAIVTVPPRGRAARH